MLYREQTFAPRAFHSELQQQTIVRQHTENSRLEPAIRDAQKLAQNVFRPEARELLTFEYPAFTHERSDLIG